MMTTVRAAIAKKPPHSPESPRNPQTPRNNPGACEQVLRAGLDPCYERDPVFVRPRSALVFRNDGTADDRISGAPVRDPIMLRPPARSDKRHAPQ